jgi:hypothetical protein
MNKKKKKKIKVEKKKSNMIRNVSVRRIPPTDTKCNHVLLKRDGYCEIEPRVPGRSCVKHIGPTDALITDEARLLFSEALSTSQALELEKLIKDSTSMDGEIAVGKIRLLDELRTLNSAKENYELLLKEGKPERSELTGDKKYDIELIQEYKSTCAVYLNLLQEYKESYIDAKNRISDLTDKISKAVERNSKIIHGTKYTITIEQLNTIMIGQLGIFENHCKGCPKLALVAQDIKTLKIKGVGSVPDISRMQGIKPLNDELKKVYKETINRFRNENEKTVEDAQVEDN